MNKILTRHASRLAAGLHGIIPKGVSARDFSAVTGFDENVSQDILDALVSSGIGRKDNGLYLFEGGDKLRTAIELLKHGISVDQVSEMLDWRDFEGLVAQILASHDFAVMTNLILTKPRMEIDVVGIRLGVAMLIDCKHWKRYSASALDTAVKKQIERTKHYISKTQGAMAVPVIVTLYQDKLDFIDRVPIVPILQLSSFIDEFYGNLDKMHTIETT